MKHLLKISLTLLVLSLPVRSYSQNWMMAQQYAQAAIDSLLESDEVDPLDMVLYEYDHFTYNPVKHEFSLFLKDDPDAEEAKGLVTVSLYGGYATFESDIIEPTEVLLPDWSQSVFIWNGADSKISFSLSCNDSDFYTYSLEKNNLNRFACGTNEFVYVKINTVVDGNVTGQIHYKLEKGNGYKVVYDTTSSKFEVFADNRIN